MTLDEALCVASSDAEIIKSPAWHIRIACAVLATEVRRLQSEADRIPAQRAQPTVKSDPVGECNDEYWRLAHETDEEFAAKGRAYTEVAE